jgi:hypothetical protein
MILNSRNWGIGAVLAVLVGLLTPGSASAFPDEPASLDEGFEGVPRHERRFHILPELGFFRGTQPGDIDVTLVSPMFEFRLQFAEHFIFQGLWGGTYINVRQGDDISPGNTFRSGNAYGAFHYQGAKGEFSYRFGAGVTIPIATVPDDPGANQVRASLAYATAAGIRGNWNYWLWNPHTVSVIVPLRLERRRSSGFLWGTEFDVGAMISIDSRSSDFNGAYVGMLAMLGYEVTSWFRTGANFTLVLLPGWDGSTNAKTQLAVEPFFRFGTENQFGAAKLLINIDSPNGFAFDKQGLWGVNLVGGFAF